MRTERLLLVPIGWQQTADLVALHNGPDVAHWYAGRWTAQKAAAWADQMGQAWRASGVGKWMAYLSTTGDLNGRGGLSWP